jgi:hypothetical protein
MEFPPVDARIEAYMRQLSGRHDEPVLLEMEQLGRDRDFPIIDRLVGELVEVLALSIGARRVFEMGSGYGYSQQPRSRRTVPVASESLGARRVRRGQRSGRARPHAR